ncbi:hypothetical protein [Anaerotignum sp. MB30-C6]|uniref:hypothetical protein n=1 Tax=Anaerotignum sp. MB30-C6 TaxID=3070814 RepID=UPI0027DDE017|nr:hypothetical protein [Anaerotignum sp. MB30-C6]WMI81552.1 hypothetical protein RBQ60_02115 [Anaerotignum sp. MB30-C6]
MQTFLEFYQREIQPRIGAIDVFLKTEPQPYDLGQVADLLCLSTTELLKIMEQEKFAIIMKGTFLHLMQISPSPFCKMFRREVSRGMASAYSVQDISYIYDLALKDVEVAAEKIGKCCFSSGELPLLFEEIFISDKQYRL